MKLEKNDTNSLRILVKFLCVTGPLHALSFLNGEESGIGYTLIRVKDIRKRINENQRNRNQSSADFSLSKNIVIY